MKPHTLLCLLGWFSLVLPFGMPFLFTEKPKVNLTPDSVDRCTTENQTMVCEVVDQNYNVSDVVFEINGKQMEPDDIEIINNSTAMIHLHNLSQDMNNRNVMCCVVSCDSFSNVDSVSVQVYVKPVPVEDLSCIIYDYSMNVTCTWDYGVDYMLRGIWPKVILYVGLLNTESVANWTIPDLQTRQEFTEISDSRLFNQPEVTISFLVKSKCGLNMSTTFEGHDVIKVEPKPVSKFVSMSLNSTCIHLSWEHNRKTYAKSYTITAQSVWGSKQIYLNESVYYKNISACTICDLIPATNYSFEIKVKPLPQPGIWSVPMITSNKTAKEVPGSSPSVTHGGYSWKRKDCQNGLPLRIIYIYWQPIPAIHFHGVLKGTRLNFTSDEGTDSILLQDLSANFTVKQLSCYKTYNVTLQAENDMGLSAEPSSIFITAADTDVTNDLRVERNISSNNTVYLEWTGNVQSETVSTVFYTEENGPEPDCGGISKGQASWVKFSPGATSGIITLPVGKEPEDYCYARAVETRGRSSGFEWSSCIYVGDIAPSRSPSDLQVTVGNEDNTLVLTWSKWLCPKGEPYIKQYEIAYGPHGQHPNVTNDVVVRSFPREQTSEVLKDLDSDRLYDVRIRAVTRFGTIGPWSEAVSGQPVDNSLKTEAIVGIVFGCVFAATIIIAALVFLIRKFRRHATKKLDSMRAIDTPEVIPDTLPDKRRHSSQVYSNLEVQSTEISDDRKTTDLSLNLPKLTPQRQNSDDSGVPEDPLTPPINDVPRMEKIPEDYSRAVPGFQNGYVTSEGLTVAHIANGSVPTQPSVMADSYVKADHLIHINAHLKDDSPILTDEGEDGNKKFGNDNTAFTDDQGNHGSDIAKEVQLHSNVSDIITRPLSESFHDTQAEIKTGSVTTADTKSVNEDLKKQTLLTNPFVPRVSALELNSKTDKQSDLNSNSANSLTSMKDGIREREISSYVDADDFTQASDQRCKSTNTGETNTGYISQTSLLFQHNNPSALKPDLAVLNQSASNDVTNMVGYVFDPPMENLSKGQILESDYVAHSEVHNHSEAQTGQPNNPLHDQLDTKTNMSANIPDPVIGNQTYKITDSQSHYVSHTFPQNQSTIQPTLTGILPQSSQHSQSQTDKNFTDYVPHSFILNITAKPPDNTDYVLHEDIPEPTVDMATTSDITSSKLSNLKTVLQKNHDNLQNGHICSSSLEQSEGNLTNSKQIEKLNQEKKNSSTKKSDVLSDEDDESKVADLSSQLLSSPYVVIDENNKIRPVHHETLQVNNREDNLNGESNSNDSGIDNLENSGSL